jgi:hypothetical protein
VTRLLDPPRPIEVELGEDGEPCSLRGAPRAGLAGLAGPVEAVQGWITEMDWWRDQPIAREYWRVLLHGRLLCEVFRDRTDGAWYLERVYD